MDIGEKVSLLRTRYSGGNNLKFAELMEESPGTTSNWCKAKSLGREVLVKILSKLPDVNANWLLMDKGEMLNCTPEDKRQRLKEVMEALGMNASQFAKKIDLPKGAVEKMLTGDLPISTNTHNRLETIGVSLDWYLGNGGPMFKSDQSKAVPPVSDNTVSYKFVPLLNLDAVGSMHGSNLTPEGSEYPEKLIPFTDAQDGDVALTISGESMSPTCPAGSKVLIREVENWREYFGFGNIFVIHLSDGRRILKEVQKYPEDSKNYILCKSHNDRYPEEELPKSMISGVWKVIKILNERGW